MRCHSLFASALCLSLFQTTSARVTFQKRDVTANPQNGILDRLLHLFRRDPAQLEVRATCVEDDILAILQNLTIATPFCSIFLSIAPATTVVEYTPTSTFTTITGTQVSTTTVLVRKTPEATVTTTISTTAARKKRSPEPTAGPDPAHALDRRNAEAVEAFIDGFLAVRQVAASGTVTSSKGASTTTPANATFVSQLSSACSCISVTQSTVTSTYTDQATVRTLNAFVNTVETAYTTKTAATVTRTVNVTKAVSFVPVTTTVMINTAGTISPVPMTNNTSVVHVTGGLSSTTTSSSSLAPATPTSVPFTCPDDHNQTISQLVGTELYDYLVLCGSDISDPSFLAVSYRTFAECVGACSKIDDQFMDVVCAGVAYYPTSSAAGQDNCFLKGSANTTIRSPGINAAILKRVAMAVTNTSSPSGGFDATSTVQASPINTASVVSSMMSNSTSSMPLITPGPVLTAARPGVGFTTYTVNGTTYSSATVWSTYYTSNGSWYSSYYTSWVDAWTSTTYAASQESGAASAGSGSGSVSGSGSGGAGGGIDHISETNITYVTDEGNGITNITEVLANTTYYINGSTAAATTTITFMETGGSSSGGGNGSNGGSGSGGVTVFNSGTAVSTSRASSTAMSGGQTIYNSTTIINGTTGTVTNSSSSSSSGGGGGGSGGGGAFGAVASGYTTVSTMIYTFAIAGSTGYSTSYVVSGLAPTPSINATAIVHSGGSAFGTGFVLSGAIPTSSGNTTASIVAAITSFETAAASTTFPLNGAPRAGTASTTTATTLVSVSSGGSGGASGTAASGPIIPSSNMTLPAPTSPESSTAAPRVGSETTSSTVSGSPSGRPTPLFNSSSGLYTFSTPASIPSGTGFPTISSNMSTLQGPVTAPTSTPSSSAAPRSGTATTDSLIPSVSLAGTASGGLPVPSSNGSMPAGPTGPTSTPSSSGGNRSGVYSTTTSIPMFQGGSGYYGPHLSTGTAPRRSPMPHGNSSTPAGATGPTSPVSSTDAARSGTASTDTPTLATPGTCVTTIRGTTTMWETTTVYGCYSSCPPLGYGHFGPFPTYGPAAATTSS
ncbi:hypothetical protein LTR66_001638 [Elasticomyces elasticus]|nr:hypothetical protein LTR66_001638 [Elasticomyces elasticus]